MLDHVAKPPTTPASFVLITFTESDRAYQVQRALSGARVVYGIDGAAVGPVTECPGNGYCVLLPPVLGTATDSARVHSFHRWVVDTLSLAEGLAVHLYSA